MRVSELSGRLLDYWAAKAEQQFEGNWYQESSGYWVRKGDRVIFCPSKSWEVGGPIIEREKIAISNCYVAEKWHAELVHPALEDGRQLSFSYGETPLIAAMRAYVCSKFGEEVPEIE